MVQRQSKKDNKRTGGLLRQSLSTADKHESGTHLFGGRRLLQKMMTAQYIAWDVWVRC